MATGAVSVRQATPGDATDLARLLNEFDGAGATPTQVAARMAASAQVLTTYLSELAGRPVGFACLRLIPHIQGDAPYAELTDVYVEEPSRRQGVASALLAHIEVVARAAGAGELILITDFDNEQAQAAYRAGGYARWALAMKRDFAAD